MIPQTISNLIRKFEENIRKLKASGNETQMRVEYLNPFFRELGWDIENERYDGVYREVSHEYTIRDEHGNAKKTDYCFQVGNMPMFFVEAKTPSVNLDKDPKSAYQLRKYGWNAKTGLGILTNFEEFAIYDCRYEPKITDTPKDARIEYFRFEDYETKWDYIVSLFSRNAVVGGSLNEYVKTLKISRGALEVDEAFLKEMETWREMLAINIVSRNSELSQRQINLAVQRTIDRIIFLRICEDRDIEPYGNLQKLQKKKNLYSELTEIYHNADRRYDSGLFYFRQEKSRQEEADDLTLKLKIDDQPLKEIISRLYYPAPYAFSIMPADILGQIYERFLGKVIRLDKTTRRIDIEEKPEVRKAGGVYYTPTYIVDYIVKQTIGQQLEDKTPEQVEKLRFLDPACGSGSFLIRAYQFLLDWHLKRYAENKPEKHSKGKNPLITKTPDGNWKLSPDVRKRILLNNIYGTDIDSQAVEVTKLSLLLKVLEGEDNRSISRQLDLFRKRALPDLGRNIKCGNSLIGSDFYQGQQTRFDEEEMLRINAFDWESEFAEIMKAGGFDAVIGNPPYGFHQIHSKILKPYLKSHFLSSKGSFEHYFLFYEKALKLLNNNGIHGFIVPVTWLSIPSAHSLRKYILNNYAITEISWLPNLVFSDAKVNTLVSVIKKSKPKSITVKIYDTLGFKDAPKEKRVYKQKQFIESDYVIGIFEKKYDTDIIEKIKLLTKPLEDFARPCSGYNPYEVGKGQAPEGGLQTENTVKMKPYHSEKKLSNEWKPEIVGRDLRRYFINITGKRWIKYGNWLAAQRDPENFKGKRILVQEITGGQNKRVVSAYCEEELYYSRDVIPIKIENELSHPFYLLGIINSNFMTWYHHKRNPKAQKGLFPKVLVSDLKQLPIRVINFDDLKDKALHDQMVLLVENMLNLHKQLAQAKLPQTKTTIQRQIDATDRQIDRLVYELYGLSEEEIKIVEDNVAT